MTRTSRVAWILVLSSSLLTACVENDSGPSADDIQASQEALLPAPNVSAMNPSSGPPEGGTQVDIEGSYFGRGVYVTVDGARVDVRRIDGSHLSFTTPPHSVGAAKVQVINRNGRATDAPDFVYQVATATVDASSPDPDASAPPPSTDVDASTPSSATCTLSASGPVAATSDGQVIENLRITSTSGSGIDVSGHKNVTIRNCEILHEGGPGISFSNADGIHIQNVRVVRTNAPASGPLPDEENNITGEFSSGVVIENVRVEHGSSGVWLLESPSPIVRFVEGHDFRGPFPRGQLVQFDKCDSPLLEDFSAENPPATSWPEDNVSLFQSPNGTVRRGVLIGNNSTSGVGVMMEAYGGVGQGGLVEDVDTVDMGNGAFSAYPSANVTFRRVRARDGHCAAQAGREAPSSNSLIFAASPESSNIRLESASYAHHCNDNILWSASAFSFIDVTEQEFTARAPLRLSFCWSPPAP